MPTTKFELAPRAAHLVNAPSSLMTAHALCQTDLFNARTNPDGYINFGSAENYLLWDFLKPALSAPRPIEPGDTHYGPMYGTDKFRRLLVDFLQRRTTRTLDPEHLVVAGGAAAIIDMLAWVLFEPRDGILLAAPYYAGFDFDLEARANLRIVPVPTQADDNFALSVAQLQRAYDDAQARGIRVRGMLIANPHNPTGAVADSAHVQAWLDFAASRGLQVLVDEIYAHSVYGDAKFVSCLQQPMANIHVIYGLAKDFALSGFKIGMAYSEHPKVVSALQTLAYLSPVSADAQATMCLLLENERWVTSLLDTNLSRLAQASATTTQALTQMGATVCPAQAGLFVWVNLRRFLREDSFAGEAKLHQAILQGARLNMSPGSAFHSSEPGWFRLCFASPPDILDAGLARLAKALCQLST